MRALYVLFFIFILATQTYAQVLPVEGSKLNYRIVGLSFQATDHKGKYKIEIAAGNYNTEDLFVKNRIKTIETDDNKTIAEVPAFDKQYTWRVSTTNKKHVTTSSPFYHFSTGIVTNADTSKFRLRIMQPGKPGKDYYVSVDAGGVLYDMSGAPIWFIPHANGIGSYVADLKFTPEGTATFVYKDPYEINFNGDILWQIKQNGVVSGDTLGEFFHHEFTKLSNGHYMALGSQILLCKTIYTGDSAHIEVSKEKGKVEKDGFKFGLFGTLIEYDKEGNVVWSWKSSKYLIGSDFDYFRNHDANLQYQPHDNAFFFDEKNKCIYIGFRDISRILKVEYPSGKVSSVYGDCFKPGCHATGEGIFCGQHSIGRTMDGLLYVFNNNSCLHTDSLPTIVLLKEPEHPNQPLEKVWEYTCPVEPKAPLKFNSGGNVIELADSTLYINMGSQYSKLLIINRNKKILWSAMPERFIETDKIWAPIHQYRTNIIDRKELEKMIWRAEEEASRPTNTK